MSSQNRSTAASASPKPKDLKPKVIASLNKLADRDTLAIATAELESIACSLTPDNFSSFLSCLHNTDDSCKSSVRRHCIVLLSLLARYHGDTLSPYLPKMVSSLVRRLRDNDSAVRAACVEAAADMSANITPHSFSAVANPLIETLVHDRDTNAQTGAAMCLAAAVEAAPQLELEQVRKALPKLGKLLRSEGFKAKAALLGAMGSVVGAGGAGTKAALDWFVPCVTEFLSSEDWRARMAAAEALARVIVAEEDLAPRYKKACLVALENRRFDKVKVVRVTMNQALDSWRDVPSDTEEVGSSPARSKSSVGSEDGPVGSSYSVVRTNYADCGFKTPPQKKEAPSFTRSLSLSSNNSSGRNNQNGNPSSDRRKYSRSEETESPLSISPSDTSNTVCGPEAVESGEILISRPEAKGWVSNNIRGRKLHMLAGSKASSRVVPFNAEENYDGVNFRISAEKIDDKQKDAEDLSLIREQLAQIENQQSNLLDLLQRFIGSSQSGIISLESRVNGLEMALDEISYDLAISSGRIPKGNCSGDTCCKLPGADFLSPKFWRRTEGRFHCPKSSPSSHLRSVNTAGDVFVSHVDVGNPESSTSKLDKVPPV